MGLDRFASGCEISRKAYDYQIKEIDKIIPGSLLDDVKKPVGPYLESQGKPSTDKEKLQVHRRYHALSKRFDTKRAVIDQLSREFGRGRFALTQVFKDAPG